MEIRYLSTLGKLVLIAVIVVLLGLGFLAGRVSADEGTMYQPTPHETIASDVAELYRIGGEQEVRNYASWQPCLSVHRVDDDLVLYWWCDRFWLIDEAYRIQDVY